MRIKIEHENWLSVAHKLYYRANPSTKMDVPSSVFEIVSRWRSEWMNADTELDLFNWCIENKQDKKK